MSRRTTITCDLCGAEISAYNLKDESAQIHLNAPHEYRGFGGQRIAEISVFAKANNMTYGKAVIEMEKMKK